MGHRIERSAWDDRTFKVGDCYVWAEIQYLDSPTDYREFLPGAPSRLTCATGELVMLDSSSVSWTATVTLLSVFLAGVAGVIWEIYLALSS